MGCLEEKVKLTAGYAFGYRVRDFHTGNDYGHTQNRDLDGVTRGQYHILLPDGRIQNVRYTADDDGFHAQITYDSIHSTKK
ncbi:LOC108078764 [Sergentomyia squamirostris]